MQAADHLSVGGAAGGLAGEQGPILARHFQVIWLLAAGQPVAEVARAAGFSLGNSRFLSEKK